MKIATHKKKNMQSKARKIWINTMKNNAFQ